MMTDKVSIVTDAGERVEAVAPVVISASRSTDIPAFYARWFFNRLAKGYCTWVNPFNRQKTYVSFERCRVVVFWTKNPAPVLPYLHRLDERGIRYYSFPCKNRERSLCHWTSSSLRATAFYSYQVRTQAANPFV